MEMKNIDLMKSIEYIAVVTAMDSKTLEQKGLKLGEEAGEVAQAILSYNDACGCGYKNKGREDVIEECADAVIVAMSIMFEVGGSLEEFSEVFHEKMKKWQNKIKKKPSNGLVMVHDKCPIAKGIRFFACKHCGKTSSNYVNGKDICPDCAEEKNVCRICGEKM